MSPHHPIGAKSYSEEDFNDQSAAFAEMIDAELIRLNRETEPVANLHDGVMYSMGLDVEDRAVRGKRIRPVLCLMTTDALGRAPRKALAFACGIELLHNFALVHDDIEDGDEQRRGRPATWIKYGLAHGINIGDYMLARVFAVICRDPHNPLAIREQLMDLLHRTLEHLFIGQSLDISARASRNFSVADYQHLVSMKTGSYLVAPMLGGAIVGEADEDTITGLTRFGQALGPLFQIKDDIIDLTKGKGRGTIGNDIREGKRSYLVATTAEQCTAQEREELFDVLDKPRKETRDDDVARVIGLFSRYDAIKQGEAYCEELRKRAIESIAPAPPRLREVLETATSILVERTT